MKVKICKITMSLLVAVCMMACAPGTKSETEDIIETVPDSDTTSEQAKENSDNSEKGKVEILSHYLSENVCDNLIQVSDSVVACVVYKEQKYVIDFLELTSGSILNSIEGYFNSNTVIDVVDNNIVVYEGESWSDDGSRKEKVYILNNEYELVETVSLSDPVTSIAYVVLPIQKKILYVDYYGDEWKSCLKEMDFDKGNKRTIMKFSNVSELESLTQMKVSNDEKSIYFIGDYADSENSREQFPICIGMIDIDNKNYHVYHEAKEAICIEENGAYFYDNRVEVTDGKVLYVDNNGELKSIQTKEQNADVALISFDKKYFCSLNQNKAENETDYNTPFTLCMYAIKDGTIVYENENMDISVGVLVFNEERIICGIYYGDNGLEINSYSF